MRTFFLFSALALTLTLSACAGRSANDTGSHDTTHTSSGVEFYGDIDIGVGSQRNR